ncbi:hypothetical protein GobsT_05260 [Gemmata obscuriglobus]|nr:hypothetical protein GobsT_05260 [Gemmata obscuriglobus]VTR99652.1 unnamed protein product [Gemmata obscuriglobus UQM 2246]
MRSAEKMAKYALGRNLGSVAAIEFLSFKSCLSC